MPSSSGLSRITVRLKDKYTYRATAVRLFRILRIQGNDNKGSVFFET